MPYPINQRAHQFNSIQSVPVSFGLWDTALKFLSPGPRSDVTDHLDGVKINHLHVECTVNPQAGYLKEQGIIHVQFFVGHLMAGV